MSERVPYPSYIACVASALNHSQHPMTIDELVADVAKQRPVDTNTRAEISRAIHKLFQAVPVSPSSYGWLSNLLAGSTCRHPLCSEEIRRGFLMLDELEHAIFFPQFFQAQRPDGRTIQVELFGGPTVEAAATIEYKTWSLDLGQQFVAWVDALGGQNRDDLLITVIDADAGLYAVRLNLREMREERAIEQRNIQLALQSEELVTEDRKNRLAMPTWELVARLIGQGFFQQTPPVDDFHYVLHEYSLLRFTDGIGYQLDANVDQHDRKYNLLTTLPSSPPTSNTLAGDEEAGVSPAQPFTPPPTSIEPDFEQTASIDPYLHQDIEQEIDQNMDPMQFSVCPAYAEYVAKCYEIDPHAEPLSHDDYHLLEAELEMLVHLEQEFGPLLDEQESRKSTLAAQLFIDPEFFLLTNWDHYDDAEPDDPPFWQN